MNQRAIVSVPGKLILMGEHAAVYGRPALVAAADPRARVEVVAIASGVILELPDFDERFETSWVEIQSHAAARRDAWQRYREDPTPERFQAVHCSEPSSLVRVALGEIAAELPAARLPSIRVRVRSRLPVGSGFGSSAATAVAVVGGVLCLLEGPVPLDRIDRLAFEVERRQHGLPSGADHRTVLHGGVVWAESRGDRGLEVAPLRAASRVPARLQVYQTGQPEETTGEVVAAVKRRRQQAPEAFERLLDRMQRNVEGFRDLLTRSDPDRPAVAEVIRDYELCLEELGVVPQDVRETIRAVEAAGGAAKISGAGALTGSAAGCLLVYWPSEPPTAAAGDLSAYQRLSVQLDAEGLKVEVLE